MILFSDCYQNEVANILRDTLQSIKLSDRGVYVQASTLGSLEALLEFLRTSKIPVSSLYRFQIKQWSLQVSFNLSNCRKKSTKKILDFDKIRTQASQKLVRRYYQLNNEASQWKRAKFRRFSCPVKESGTILIFIFIRYVILFFEMRLVFFAIGNILFPIVTFVVYLAVINY